MSKNKLNREEPEEELRKDQEEAVAEGLSAEESVDEGEVKGEVKGQSQASTWKKLLRGDVLGSSFWRQQLGLIIMIVVCMIIMVGMRYKVESLQKERIGVQERIGVLREHKIQMQKRYQESVKISRIEEQLDTIGVGLISGPPYEI